MNELNDHGYMIVSMDAKNIFGIITTCYHDKNPEVGAEDMAQQFRMLATLLEDMGSIPSTHMAIRNLLNSSSGGLSPICGLH